MNDAMTIYIPVFNQEVLKLGIALLLEQLDCPKNQKPIVARGVITGIDQSILTISAYVGILGTWSVEAATIAGGRYQITIID